MLLMKSFAWLIPVTRDNPFRGLNAICFIRFYLFSFSGEYLRELWEHISPVPFSRSSLTPDEKELLRKILSYFSGVLVLDHKGSVTDQEQKLKPTSFENFRFEHSFLFYSIMQ